VVPPKVKVGYQQFYQMFWRGRVVERGETVIAPRPQKISSTRHTLDYNGYINGGKELADGGAVVSDDNPRLKEWIAKFENPNESAERRIIAQLSAREHDRVARRVITIESIHYVGFWRRFFAFFIDSIILSILAAFIHNWTVSFFLAVLYYIVLTSSRMQGRSES
jgi:hypothetical protein